MIKPLPERIRFSEDPEAGATKGHTRARFVSAGSCRWLAARLPLSLCGADGLIVRCRWAVWATLYGYLDKSLDMKC